VLYGHSLTVTSELLQISADGEICLVITIVFVAVVQQFNSTSRSIIVLPFYSTVCPAV
jgi:hypothetical protein